MRSEAAPVGTNPCSRQRRLTSSVETWFASTGVWYLVGLGAVALVFALVLPRGIWGAIEARTGLRLLPVGYRLDIRSLLKPEAK